MRKSYCWSTDGERYQGDENSREDALAEAVAETIHDEYGPEDADERGNVEWPFYTAVAVPVSAGETLGRWAAENMLEGMQDGACDHAGEAAEDWTRHISKQAKDALQAKLVAVVDQWATEYGAQPVFYGVKKRKEHHVMINIEHERIVCVSYAWDWRNAR
jgi:hypothetical protein